MSIVDMKERAGKAKTPRPFAAEGQYLKELRQKAGYSARTAFMIQLRSHFGETFNYNGISLLERGFREPKACHLVAYAKIANLTLNEILNFPSPQSAPAGQKRL